MKQRIFMFVLLLVILLLSGCLKSTPYVYEGIELLKDGNMEEEDLLSWWYGAKVEPDDERPNFAVAVDPKDTNNKCLKIDGNMDSDSFAYWAQTITDNIPIGKKVKLKVKIKTDNLTGTGAAIAIRCDDSESSPGDAEQFATTEDRILIVNSGDWRSYSVELGERVRKDIKSITVYLLFLSNSSGTIYFDDASLIY